MTRTSSVRSDWLRVEPRVQLKRVSSYVASPTKRGFDFVLALLIVMILCPVMIVIAAVIKLTSPGPILFRQVRYGARQKAFPVYKFRSMECRSAHDPEVRQATPQDPRVTPFGRFLRRTSLDELPQLINVLRGEMSLIGPRPHAVAHDEFFMNRVPRYARRFSVRPGITGLAQVSGARGETRTDADMKRRVDLDIYYIENASILLDLKILVATAHEVLFSVDAY